MHGGSWEESWKVESLNMMHQNRKKQWKILKSEAGKRKSSQAYTSSWLT